ncbi:MAG: nucleotide sugar dehydrogenase [Pseudomonadota bacterium]
MKPEQAKIAVIGLGYVGLPLSVAFGEKYPTVGFDISHERVAALARGEDATLEVAPEEIAAARLLTFTADEAVLDDCNVFVVTVPTPVDRGHVPDFGPLIAASRTIGRHVRRGDVVVYESTVYPGATEEICIPEIERISGLKFNADFFAGYSPERINPGDRQRRLKNIVKITSGSTPEAAEFVDALYRSILEVPTHRASSIRVAEAAKVIENTQRDLNISLVNELALIFDRLGIDTLEVLEAAGTKWNFLPFRPGLVGGHCIGVDPYYLIHKAREAGYYPDVITAGRRVNDGIGEHIVNRMVRLMSRRGVAIGHSRVLILGLAFKENCPDIRNTRVVDLVGHLRGWGVAVDVYDPWIDPAEAKHEYGLEVLAAEPAPGHYDGIIAAVGHREFAAWGVAKVRALGRPGAVLFDVKGLFPQQDVDARL